MNDIKFKFLCLNFGIANISTFLDIQKFDFITVNSKRLEQKDFGNTISDYDM